MNCRITLGAAGATLAFLGAALLLQDPLDFRPDPVLQGLLLGGIGIWLLVAAFRCREP